MIETLLSSNRLFLKIKLWLGCLAITSFILAGCATQRIAPVADIENTSGAFSLPYRISYAGRILLDVSINEAEARPLALDTGATISVLYGNFAETVNLEVSDRTLFVRGLVGKGVRPVIEDVPLQLGPQDIAMEQMLMLDTPFIKDEAVGLMGADIMSLFVALFNKDTLTATFIPREAIDKQAFAGWNKIPLQIFSDAQTSSRLYFAQMDLGKRDIPVLIDTGSNLNFINWKLATLDEEIERLERKLIREGTLQGALDTTSVTTETVFNDLELGKQHWKEIPVTVMGLSVLETVAPVDGPMMVAGAKVFTPHTIAFDLVGLTLYLKPE